MWKDTEREAAVKFLKDTWGTLDGAEASRIVRALEAVPHLEAMQAMERCFVQQVSHRKPSPQEIKGYLREGPAGDASLSPRMRMYREIEALDKQTLDSPTVFLRGRTYECGTSGISRKIDPQGDWRPSSSRAIPIGDLSETELSAVLQAYRTAPKLARPGLRSNPDIPENAIDRKAEGQ